MTARPFFLITAAGLALAGCSVRAHGDDGNGATASISIGNTTDGNSPGNGQQSVSINVPGFSAKLNVPGLNIGSDTTQIEDMKLYPGTAINGMHISGQAGDGSGGDSRGDVDMGFTAPVGAAQIVGWYRDQAQKGGWTIVPPAGANQFEATKHEGGRDTHFALQVAATGTGSNGHFLVTGR
jgi:hypothetical protein